MTTKTRSRRTSPKGGNGWISRARAENLTARQRAFIEFKINPPWPCSSKAARLAGYSESVARKADRIIVRGSPIVARILEKWRKSELKKCEQEVAALDFFKEYR